MLEIMLKAKLPVVSVQTDDLLNHFAVLHELAGRKVVPAPKSLLNFPPSPPMLFVGSDTTPMNSDIYKQLLDNDHQLVIVNPSQPYPYAVDGGVLPTPTSLVKQLLEGYVEPNEVQPLIPFLSGLSLKAILELVLMTQAKFGSLRPQYVRQMRGMTSSTIQGLVPLDTGYDFYEADVELMKWLELNKPYFSLDSDPRLRPRGVILEGKPGVGKTMASKFIANLFKVPLFRMDMSAVLDKYVGQSEARVARILSMVEREEPCVLLIDEVEKLFKDDSSSGVTTRILSQLLWWLSEHRSSVFTVMTTNDSSALPSELYRAGRLDKKFILPELYGKDTLDFAITVLCTITGAEVTSDQLKVLQAAFSGYQSMSHAAVVESVYDLVKANGWK